MKRILFLIFAMVLSLGGYAQDEAPQMEFVMQLNVNIAEAFSVGETAHGSRIVIPITGGTFAGPHVKGEVLPGGADYQLVNEHLHRTELEAIYCIRTDDGVSIHVRNNGIISQRDGEYYFWCTPKFEAPADSPYAWLSNGIYVCRPAGFEQGMVKLKVWKVN